METLKLNHKLSHRKGKRRNAAKSVFLPVDITSEVASEVAALRDGNHPRLPWSMVCGLHSMVILIRVVWGNWCVG